MCRTADNQITKFFFSGSYISVKRRYFENINLFILKLINNSFGGSILRRVFKNDKIKVSEFIEKHVRIVKKSINK